MGPNIWQRNKEGTKKPEVTNLKDRVPDFWHRKKVDTKKQEQKQNEMEKSECEHCNKEFASKERLKIHKSICEKKTVIIISNAASKERLKIHKSICEKKTFMKLEQKEIEKVVTIKNTEDNKEDVIIERNEEIE